MSSRRTNVTTEHVASGIAIDYDAGGKIGGIEALDDEFFRDLFFQSYMRRKVCQRLHPFSGGVLKVGGGRSNGSAITP